MVGLRRVGMQHAIVAHGVAHMWRNPLPIAPRIEDEIHIPTIKSAVRLSKMPVDLSVACRRPCTAIPRSESISAGQLGRPKPCANQQSEQHSGSSS